MRRTLVLLILCVSCLSVRGQSERPPVQTLEPDIRLPSISRQWRTPGAPEGPEITMEEMERCMGLDVELQRRVAAIRQLEQALEEERSGLESTNDQLKKRSAELSASRTQLQAQSDRLSAMGQALKRQSEDIDRRKRAKLTRQSEVDAINALVQTYNADVGQHNRVRTQWLEEHRQFSAGVDRYNVQASGLRGQVATFQEHVDAYQRQMSDFRQASQQQLSSCAGERVIRKPAASDGS